MKAQKFEAFLAKLYVDDQARSRFLADPRREVMNAGLSEEDWSTLENIDLVGLELAADSFARKRAAKATGACRSTRTRWFGFR